MTKHKSHEECGIVGFFRRVLFKLSGQKIISVAVSSMLVYLMVWARHEWYGEISDPVILHAISAIKDLCLGLLGANVLLSGADIIKGNPHDSNGDKCK